MRVHTVEQSRAFDRWAVDQLGVPSVLLMENAARGVLHGLRQEFPQAQSLHVVCGPGNNGGDGLALARQWVANGRRCRIQMLVDPEQLRGDAALQARWARALGLELEVSDRLVAGDADVVVDALFGTGLSRPLEGPPARLVAELEAIAAQVVAVDLPSGLDADRNHLIGPAARAALTVTFGAAKIAHLCDPASSRVGRLEVVDLGVPTAAAPLSSPLLASLQAEELRDRLPVRAAGAHKGTFGHLLVIAGAAGMGGAAVLCARAGLRSGAGLVSVAVPAGVRAEVAQGCWEAMTVGLGARGADHLQAADLEPALEALESRTVGVLGPGLGRAPSTAELVRGVVAAATVPLVVDADGLHALDGPGAVATAAGIRILTPHPGELARLLRTTVGEIQQDRLAAVRHAASASGAVVVLKGHNTLVGAPDGEVRINGTGNPGMATGGTGDVLAGMIGALLAQGVPPLDAASIAVFVHGAAGDAAAVHRGFGLTAGDVVEALAEGFDVLVA